MKVLRNITFIAYQDYHIKANVEVCFSSTACNSFGHTNKAPRLQKPVMSLEWSWSCVVHTCPKTMTKKPKIFKNSIIFYFP